MMLIMHLDKVFIHSDTQILSILSHVSEKGMLIQNLITLVLRFCQFYPTFQTKDVDNEFIHSGTQIFVNLIRYIRQMMLIKHLFNLILRFCQFYPMYLREDVYKKKNLFTLTLSFCQFYPTIPTKDVDKAFIHSDTQILSIIFVVSDKRC